VQTAYETRQAYALEHRIVRPDGVVRVLHAHGEVIADDAQRPVRMLGTSQDITERTTTRTGSGETEQRVSHGV
jgi:PAS domain S-box-containing protein